MPNSNKPKPVEALFEGNESFSKRFAAEEPELMAALAKGQSPKIFWLGCSDSRCPDASLTQAKPGQIFVHRNIANSFPEGDTSSFSALSFAIKYLKVQHVVVCGHTSCGGIAAGLAASAEPNKSLDGLDDEDKAIQNWIAPIKNLAVTQQSELSSLPEKERLRKLVEEHVKATVLKVTKSKPIQNAWKDGRSVTVHGTVYDIETAKLIDLEVDQSRPE